MPVLTDLSPYFMKRDESFVISESAVLDRLLEREYKIFDQRGKEKISGTIRDSVIHLPKKLATDSGALSFWLVPNIIWASQNNQVGEVEIDLNQEGMGNDVIVLPPGKIVSDVQWGVTAAQQLLAVPPQSITVKLSSRWNIADPTVQMAMFIAFSLTYRHTQPMERIAAFGELTVNNRVCEVKNTASFNRRINILLQKLQKGDIIFCPSGKIVGEMKTRIFEEYGISLVEINSLGELNDILESFHSSLPLPENDEFSENSCTSENSISASGIWLEQNVQIPVLSKINTERSLPEEKEENIHKKKMEFSPAAWLYRRSHKICLLVLLGMLITSMVIYGQTSYNRECMLKRPLFSHRNFQGKLSCSENSLNIPIEQPCYLGITIYTDISFKNGMRGSLKDPNQPNPAYYPVMIEKNFDGRVMCNFALGNVREPVRSGFEYELLIKFGEVVHVWTLVIKGE